MISAFGVDHGEISKGRVPWVPKKVRLTHPDSAEGTRVREVFRPASKLLKEKHTGSWDDVDGTKIRLIRGGGLTTAGKVTAGTAAGGTAAGTGVLVHRKRKKS